MNKIYRHVWSKVHNALIPVSEIAGSVSPKSGPRNKQGIVFDPKTKITEKSQKAQLARALALLLAGVSPVALALPSGGHVQHGQASIHVQGNNLTVDQGTQKAIINWQKFGIKPNESVNFNQPNLSSITLNRVIGNNPSKIMGHLSANGQIFLVNPSGITFGSNASVDVGGIVASTLNITNKNFLNNNYQFQGSSTNSVINKGNIKTSQGGSVAFIGHKVNNQGQISTPGGTTAMGAGSRVDLTLSNNHLLHFAVKQSALKASAKNGGLIKANHGGKVVLTAHAKNAALKTVVNNKGVIRAHSVKKQQGHIALLGGKSGTTRVSGTLDASANTNTNTSTSTDNSKPNQKVNGGKIETSGAHVKIANDSQIITKGQNGGLNGTWTVDPTNFTIGSNTSNSDITNTKLNSQLSSNNVTIKSSQGANGSSGNIIVNAPVSWNSNKLTLSAYNNIIVNASMNVTSNGSLVFYYGQGSSNGKIKGKLATDNIKSSVNLGTNAGFSTKSGSNGSVVHYHIVNKLGTPNSTNSNTLQGMGASSNLNKNYALGSNINAKPTSTNNTTWGTNGFKPIGANKSTGFTGQFDGLGHTIKNLKINRLNNKNNRVGLFSYTSGSILRNIGLKGGSITGSSTAGGLVGFGSNTTIIHAYMTGNVTGGGNTGGLVGFHKNGVINHVYTTGNVQGSGGDVGGLIGLNSNQKQTTLSNAYTTGNVSGGGLTGGLVGDNIKDNIHNAYTTGHVTGKNLTGGLVGENKKSNITNAYHTTGAVNGTSVVGGLIGSNHYGLVKKSYTKSNVTGSKDTVGGLIGINNNGNKSKILNDYTTGTITGTGVTGGLIGNQSGGLISNSYSTGNVTSVKKTSNTVTYGTGTGGLVGLAGSNSSSTTQSNMSMHNVYATGNIKGGSLTGGLVGGNSNSNFDPNASITHAYATGSVTGTGNSNSGGANNVGGLFGTTQNTPFSNVYATGNVQGNGDSVGGLIGTNTGSNAVIRNAHATGNVSGKRVIGGLVGNNASSVYKSYATGNVTDSGFLAGGLIGGENGSSHVISNVHATGIVKGTSVTGGLVGSAGGATIKKAYATGSVNGSNAVGGLVGSGAGATISTAYASGQVKGANVVGGLVGANSGSNASIKKAYATGSVIATGFIVGGLIGSNGGTLSHVYADGLVQNGSNSPVKPGALVGTNTSNAIIKKAYWDSNTSGTIQPIGTNNAPSSNTHITGLTNSNMQQQSSFKGFDFTKKPVWKIYNGHTKPLLNVFLTPLTISGGPSSNLTYGKTVAQVLPYFTYSKSVSLSSGHIKAQIGSATTSNGNKIQTGTYNPFFYSNQQGYNITNHASALTISKKQLNLSSSFVNNPTKIYNGNNSITISKGNIKVSGFQGSQSSYKSTNQVNGSFAQSGAGSKISVNAPISTNDFSFNSNVNLSNYKFPSSVKGTGTIKPKQLTAHITNNPTKVYNGTNGATIASGNINLNGFIGSQGASASTQQVSGTYAQSNAGSNIKVSANISSNNFNPNSNTTLSNYKVPNSVSGKGTIKPKQLNANIINNPTKVYNGTNGATIAQGNATLSGFVGNQGASASTQQVSGTYAQTNAGKNIKLSASLSTQDFKTNSNTSFANYKIPSHSTSHSIKHFKGTGTIKPKQLTASFAHTPTKTYNGTNGATIASGNINLNGFVGNQGTSASIQKVSGTYAQANAGKNIKVSANISSHNFNPNSNTTLSNYKVPNSVSGKGTIKPKQLNANIINNPTKVYNGQPSILIPSGDTKLNGFVGNQGAQSNPIQGHFVQSKPGHNIKIITSPLKPNDFQFNSNTISSNYVIPNTAQGTGTIKQHEYKTGSQPSNQQHAATNHANQLNQNHSNTQQSKQSSRQVSRKICIKEPGSNNGSKETVSSLLNIVNGGINEPQGVSQKIITIHTGSTISGSGSIKTRCFKPKQ